MSATEEKANSSNQSQVLDQNIVDGTVSADSLEVDIDRIRSCSGCDNPSTLLDAVRSDRAVERGEPDGRGSDARISRIEVPLSTVTLLSRQHYSGGEEGTNDSQKGGSDVALLRWPFSGSTSAMKKARKENQTFKWLLGFARWKRSSAHATRSGY